jgi:predicted nucleic-acid-binding protein
MEVKAVDTNILVRFLVRDDEKQAASVYQLFKTAETKKETLFVSLLVVLEMIWVLESVYAVPRNEILDSISDLMTIPIFKIEQQSALQQFISSARGSEHDLPDLLIAHSAKKHGCETTLTFDKKASRYTLFELVN